jgi:hypothetical protein
MVDAIQKILISRRGKTKTLLELRIKDIAEGYLWEVNDWVMRHNMSADIARMLNENVSEFSSQRVLVLDRTTDEMEDKDLIQYLVCGRGSDNDCHIDINMCYLHVMVTKIAMLG